MPPGRGPASRGAWKAVRQVDREARRGGAIDLNAPARNELWPMYEAIGQGCLPGLILAVVGSVVLGVAWWLLKLFWPLLVLGSPLFIPAWLVIRAVRREMRRQQPPPPPPEVRAVPAPHRSEMGYAPRPVPQAPVRLCPTCQEEAAGRRTPGQFFCLHCLCPRCGRR